MSSFDRINEQLTRRLARGTSRRSLLARLSALALAAPVFPLLPVARAAAAGTGGDITKLSDFERNAQTKDPAKCTYWRHCALDGIMCGCCGGGPHTCPAGAEPSPIAWIGTCRNPDDGRSYVIAYRDCCGKTPCAASDCDCNTSDRDLPVYRPSNSNDILWCFGKASATYHCSTAALVGPAS
ncbi:MAG TPA: methylamine dehydrogenase light chain [Rhizomicrobium sp.]|nr:methylamine dehydrogenase light chain [Rhizomicrobium sp.]